MQFVDHFGQKKMYFLVSCHIFQEMYAPFLGKCILAQTLVVSINCLYPGIIDPAVNVRDPILGGQEGAKQL